MEAAAIVSAEERRVLAEVLECHCDAANIRSGTPEYEAEGARVVALYESGARTIYQLLAGLNETKGDCAGRAMPATTDRRDRGHTPNGEVA